MEAVLSVRGEAILKCLFVRDSENGCFQAIHLDRSFRLPTVPPDGNIRD